MRRGRGEAHPQAALAGGQAKRECDVRLAHSGVAQAQHVLTPRDPLTARQFQHQLLVERWDGQVIESLQALHHRKPCRLDPPLCRAPVAVQHLGFHQSQQKALEVHALLGALLGELRVVAQHGRQLQLLQVPVKPCSAFSRS